MRAAENFSSYVSGEKSFKKETKKDFCEIKRLR